jgi:hypothetical protein
MEDPRADAVSFNQGVRRFESGSHGSPLLMRYQTLPDELSLPFKARGAYIACLAEGSRAHFLGERASGTIHLVCSAAARRRRRRVLRLRRRGSRFGGIPSFSAAVSETESCAASGVATASATRRSPIGVLGHSDQAGELGRKLLARHWSQSRQIRVPLPGSATGHRIEGILPRRSALRTCSVSLAQSKQ